MADRTQNVGRVDRIVRAILGTVAAVVMGWLFLSVPLGAGVVALQVVLGAFVLVTLVGALTGTCGVYAALGIDTCSCVSDAPAESWS